MNSKGSIRFQIDLYRRRYHLLDLYRGIISFVSLFAVSLTVLGLMEYFLYLSSAYKGILFTSWSLLIFLFFFFWVIKPILALVFKYKALSDRDVAIRMGKDTPQIEDRILNFIELEENTSIDESYLSAILEQKTISLNGVNLLESLTSKRVVRAGLIALIPMIIIGGIGGYNSKLLLEGSSRFLDYSTAYKPEAPFEFLSPYYWEVESGKDVLIELRLEGSSIGDKAYIYLNGDKVQMQKTGTGSFTWQVERVTQDVDILFECLGFTSNPGRIHVLKVPALLELNLSVIPPKYTGILPFEIEGSGEGIVPMGSKVLWNMRWVHADSLFVVDELDSVVKNIRINQSQLTAALVVTHPIQYKLKSFNNNGLEFVSGLYSLDILEDEFPKISVEYEVDTLTRKLYLSGEVSDDYGIKVSQVVLHGEVDQWIDLGSYSTWSTVLSIASDVHSFSVQSFDNDGIKGSKKTNIGPFPLDLLSSQDREEQLNVRDDQRVRELERFINDQEQLKELQQELNQHMIQGESSWKQSQKKQQLIRQQERSLQNWERMLDQFKRENNERILNDPNNEDNVQRREELEKLMEEMKTDKLQELVEEMKQNSENLENENLRDWMRRIENENRKMEMNAQRLEELLKRLAFEQNLDRALEDLERLQQRQEDLSNRDDDTKEEQDRLNEAFESWKNELDSLKKENSELEHLNDIELDSQKVDETSESMEDSSDELERQDTEGANEKQNKSSESMKEMMDQMSSSIFQMQMDQHIENLENLRRLLSNLIHLSVDQEDLSVEVTSRGATDLVVVSWMQKQQDLSQSFELVQDSLEALISRVPQVGAIVTEWTVETTSNMVQSKSHLSERMLPNSKSTMREAMLALNELSLLLDGTMDQIQQQLSGMMKGDQQCNKPGGGKPSMSNMRKLQQQLSQQMQEMGMQKGNKPGKGQEGSQGESSSNQGESQEIVEMMMRQAEIRQMLQDLGSTGNNGNGALDELLDENERDLLNGNFDTEFMDRQREIEIRMLELEDAEKVQEQDEQRNSSVGNRYQELLRTREQEYLDKQRREREYLRYESPALTPYYRERSGLYLRAQ